MLHAPIKRTAYPWAKPAFYIFAVLYLLGFCLPAYHIHPLVELLIRERFALPMPADSLWGYQVPIYFLKQMVDSPLLLLANMANFIVLFMFAYQLIRPLGAYILLKNALVILMLVGTVIWPLLLRTGFDWGYYLWALGALGMSFCFLSQPLNQSKDTALEHTDILDADYFSS